jgi:hypothetical protein
MNQESLEFSAPTRRLTATCRVVPVEILAAYSAISSILLGKQKYRRSRILIIKILDI